MEAYIKSCVSIVIDVGSIVRFKKHGIIMWKWVGPKDKIEWILFIIIQIEFAFIYWLLVREYTTSWVF